MLERSVEETLTREAKRRGVWSPKGRMLAGWPDRPLLAPGGRIAFVETKRPGKVARPLQRWVHKRLRSLGFRVAVIDHPDQVIPFLEEWLG